MASVVHAEKKSKQNDQEKKNLSQQQEESLQEKNIDVLSEILRDTENYTNTFRQIVYKTKDIYQESFQDYMFKDFLNMVETGKFKHTILIIL